MKILRIVPKAVFVEFEMSYEDVLLLKRGLEVTELNLDTNAPYDLEVDTYFKKKLYPLIEELVTNLENGA